MGKVYIYVVDRDFGFAPNPFHGYCTLATCKPGIRKTAAVGDWIVGLGGGRLKATGKCIYAMRVTEKLTFDSYWSDARFLNKRPVRNGSKKMMVGDNIYSIDPATREWRQADSHHSNVDGSINYHNLKSDTSSDNVLISDHFYYFGKGSEPVPTTVFASMEYQNRRGYRVFDYTVGRVLIDWIEHNHSRSLNRVLGNPYDFDHTEKRYSGSTNRIT